MELYPSTSAGQISCNRKKVLWLAASESVVYAASMTGLYFLWYENYPFEKFHFFNDIHGWMGMDKIGHHFTSYHLGKAGYELFYSACPDRQKALWYGGLLGFAFLTSVEIFDGFSQGWGASPYDILANTTGALSFIAQQKFWNEQKIVFKFSFLPSPYHTYNPDILGHSFAEQLLKDYNGQTYWLSFNLKSLSGIDKIPSWLNFSLGYSANEMINGYQNPTEINGKPIPEFVPYSRYFCSLDVDFYRIPVNSRFLKILFKSIGFIKFPFPTLEYNSRQGFIFRPLYF